MRNRSGSLLILPVLILTWGGGCHRGRKENERLLAESSQTFDRLAPRLAELRAALEPLRQDVEGLAARVPAGVALRSRYFGADEVVGVLDAKLKWLAGRFESARRDPTKEEVMSLRDAVAQTSADLGQVMNAVVELSHEKARLERVAVLLKAPYEHALPTGHAVKAAKDGVESRLIAFLEDANPKVARTGWLDLDRIRFMAGGAAIDFQVSRSQLENIAQILRAYPGVRLKIGGYAVTGSTSTSKKLAVERALAVRKALVSAGVDSERLQAAGYLGERSAGPANVRENGDGSGRVATLATVK